VGSANGWFSINSVTYDYFVFLVAEILRAEYQNDRVKRLEVFVN
jgi:hypothetical protein